MRCGRDSLLFPHDQIADELTVLGVNPFVRGTHRQSKGQYLLEVVFTSLSGHHITCSVAEPSDQAACLRQCWLHLDKLYDSRVARQLLHVNRLPADGASVSE